MGKNKKPLTQKPSFDNVTNLYRLKIKKIILESDNPAQFHLRQNEFLRINEARLPEKIKFILQDDTLSSNPKLVNVKVILQRIEAREFWIRIEESSEVSRWKVPPLMADYFNARVQHISTRQKKTFDLLIQSSYMDGKYFLLQYDIHIKDLLNSQIIKLVRSINNSVFTSSENFNKQNGV